MKNSGIQLIAEFYGCSTDVLNHERILKQVLMDGIEKSNLHQINVTSHKFDPIGITVIAIINESHIAIHTYPEAHHASIDIFHCSTDSYALFRLLEFLQNNLHPKSVKFMEISRGDKLEINESNSITSHSRYGFEVRYFYNKKLVDHKSKYQKIVVIENITFGRMLFLDGELQIAEKDVDIFNKAMISPLINGNKIDNVAILGGGDGGVLNELLKHKIGKVTLVEIDEEVIAVSKRYFEKLCGNAFYDPQVTIVIDDANNFLDSDGSFDAIIYDLTSDAELLTIKEKRQFLSEIYSKIQKNLREDGMVSIQCCSEFDTDTFKLIQELLSKYFTDVTFHTVFIPSYCEPWVFGSARPKK
ncbi:MAG: adenosylmethionine decarboxylase [bacterium]